MEYLLITSIHDVMDAILAYCKGPQDALIYMIELIGNAPNRPAYKTDWAPWWNACADALFLVALARTVEADYLPIGNQHELECTVHNHLGGPPEIQAATALMIRDAPDRPAYGTDWAAWWNANAAHMYREIVDSALGDMYAPGAGL